MKGWDYARQNPDEAAKIVLDNDATGAQTEKHQKRMMGEIDKLIDSRQGQARPGRLRAHGRDPAASGGDAPGDHQGAGRRLDPRGRRRRRCKQHRRVLSRHRDEERPIVQQSRTIKGDPS